MIGQKRSVIADTTIQFVEVMVSPMRINVSSPRRVIGIANYLRSIIGLANRVGFSINTITIDDSDQIFSLLIRLTFTINQAPKIISPPEDTTNNTDSSVAFFCEATGWPIPEIGWKFELDGVEQSIPLSKAIENNRFEIKSNESSKYTAISWLQIVETNRNDSGNYICVATNSEGSDKAKAYLTIGNFQKKFDPID